MFSCVICEILRISFFTKHMNFYVLFSFLLNRLKNPVSPVLTLKRKLLCGSTCAKKCSQNQHLLGNTYNHRNCIVLYWYCYAGWKTVTFFQYVNCFLSQSWSTIKKMTAINVTSSSKTDVNACLFSGWLQVLQNVWLELVFFFKNTGFFKNGTLAKNGLRVPDFPWNIV